MEPDKAPKEEETSGKDEVTKEIEEILENSFREEMPELDRVALLIEEGEKDKPLLDQDSINIKTYRGNKCKQALKLRLTFAQHFPHKTHAPVETSMFCLKEYDTKGFREKERHNLDLEVRASQLLHVLLKDQVVNIRGYVQKDGLCRILMDHIGEKNVGKFYLELDSDELKVLKRIGRAGKKGKIINSKDREIASYLLEMGFVFKKNDARYFWDGATGDRFEIVGKPIKEKDSYRKDREQAFRGVIDTIFAVERELSDLVAKDQIVLRKRSPYQKKFFEKFDSIITLLGNGDSIDQDKLSVLYGKNIGEPKAKAETVPILGNAYLKNFIELLRYTLKQTENGNSDSEEKKIVAVTDLGHLTRGSWLTSYSDIIEFGRVMCGFDKDSYRNLWTYAQLKLNEQFGVIPEDLILAQGFDRTAYYVGVSCSQYLKRENLTPGLERYQVNYIRKGCKHLLSMLDDRLLDLSGNEREHVFSEEFRNTYRPIFEKLKKKRL